jgi:hypothetical protein
VSEVGDDALDEVVEDEVEDEFYDDGPSVWTSDAELDLEDARRLTSRRGATLTMFLGETGVGKTTLLAELWTDLLLHGSLGSVRFAGSCTALPFEQRAFESRMESGVMKAFTLKTYEEDDGFLHLRVSPSAGRVVELLLSDFAGEHFVRIREGTALEDELPWAGRADRFVVVLDAKAATSPGEGEVVVTRTERLLHALDGASDVVGSRRLALVVAKDDAVEDERRDGLSLTIERLQKSAHRFDPGTSVIHVAARPAHGVAPYGLDSLLQWLAADSEVTPSVLHEAATPARAFARFRA